MDKFLYVAMSGAKHNMLSQSITTNNLANINTPGFREDLAMMKAAYLDGEGYKSRVYSVTESAGMNQTPGALMTTGRDLDVAIDGDGWIAIQNGQGREGYTRTASLQVSSNGLLTTSAGDIVLGNDNGPVTIPPYEKIEIGNDGTISVRPLGQAANTMVEIDRIKLIRSDDSSIEKGSDGLVYLRNGSDTPADASVKLVTGALEESNVNGVNAMVKMIALSRQFETDVKMMKTAEEIDKSSAQLIRIS